MKHATACLAVLLSLCLLLCAGCTQKPADPAPAAPAVTQTTPDPAPAVTQTTPDPAPAGPEPTSEPAPPEDPTIRVDSVEALLDAIAPGAQIVLAPGRYNLSEFTRTAPDDWNAKHNFVQIEDCFDGEEIFIGWVNELSISGETDDPADTEIVTESRYASVLNFEKCDDLHLSGLTLGHTEGASCSGNVLNLAACMGIELRHMDLFGCGVRGIWTGGLTTDLNVYGSTIRDCESGPFEFSDGRGVYTFTDCVLAGSGGGGYYWSETDASSLTFLRCTFGQAETNRWYFAAGMEPGVTAEDCVWSEITEYPDYSGEDEITLPDFSKMYVIPFDAEVVSGTTWYGVTEDDCIPMLTFFEDGTAVLENYFDEESEPLHFDWVLDSEYSGSLDGPEAHGSFTLYNPDEAGEGDTLIWMWLKVGDMVFWMY